MDISNTLTQTAKTPLTKSFSPQLLFQEASGCAVIEEMALGRKDGRKVLKQVLQTGIPTCLQQDPADLMTQC